MASRWKRVAASSPTACSGLGAGDGEDGGSETGAVAGPSVAFGTA